jgi:hypothetical protein
MARFGKILVFVHLGLSLCFAAWAVALYTNRVDWTERKATPTRPAGVLVGLKADYDTIAKDGVRPADLRWRYRRSVLNYQEALRPYERAFYARELALLDTGLTPNRPARQVNRGAEGLPAAVEGTGYDRVQMGPLLDKEGNPRKDRDGQPLKLLSKDYYTREIARVIADIGKAKQSIEAAAKREKDATDELKDSPTRKGLQTRLREEAAKQALVEAEYDEVRPEWLNASVELLNLDELRKRLAERIKELGGKDNPKAATGAE